MADSRSLVPEQPPSAPPPGPPDGPGITIAQFLRVLTPVAWVTPAITVILVAAFIVSSAFGVGPMNPTGQELLEAGGGFGPALIDGEWWRLLSATVLHAGLLHLAFNLWALWNAGQLTERIFGNTAFIAIYLLSGVGSSLLSIATKPLSISVGASGAIFGVYGALLAFALNHRGVFPPEVLHAQRNSLLGFLFYNVIFAFTVPNIDLAGHAGGFGTGFAAGMILQRDLLHPREHLARRAIGVLALAGLLALAAVGVLKRVEAVPQVKGRLLAAQALTHLRANEHDQAIKLYDEALGLVQEPDWFFNRGLAKLARGEGSGALGDFQSAHIVAATNATREAICNASGIALSENTGDRAVMGAAAVKACSDAIEKDAKNPRLYAMRAAIHLDLDQLADAETDARQSLALAPDDPWPLGVALGVAVRQSNVDLEERLCVPLLEHEKLDLWVMATCAEVAKHRGEFEVARERVDRAVAEYPREPSPLILRSTIHDDLGQVNAVGADLERALELEPDNAMALNNRAWHKIEVGDFAGAKKDADRSLELQPDATTTLGTRCFAQVGLGEFSAARKDCARSVELNPPNPLDQGMLDYLDGKKARAAAAWSAASEEDPSLRRQLAPWIERAQAR